MLKEIVIEAYEVFSRKVHDLPKFEFKPTERELKQIDGFIAVLDKKYSSNSLGREFIFNFMAFQYDYYSTLDHQAKNRIPLNWVAGKKGLDRWINRTEEDLYHCTMYARELGLHVGLIKTGIKKKKNNVSTLSHHEEIEKQRFYNKDGGLVNCIETTTLFNDKSSWCKLCKHKVKCKEMLKKNLPKFYIARGYF